MPPITGHAAQPHPFPRQLTKLALLDELDIRFARFVRATDAGERPSAQVVAEATKDLGIVLTWRYPPLEDLRSANESRLLRHLAALRAERQVVRDWMRDATELVAPSPGRVLANTALREALVTLRDHLNAESARVYDEVATRRAMPTLAQLDTQHTEAVTGIARREPTNETDAEALREVTRSWPVQETLLSQRIARLQHDLDTRGLDAGDAAMALMTTQTELTYGKTLRDAAQLRLLDARTVSAASVETPSQLAATHPISSPDVATTMRRR